MSVASSGKQATPTEAERPGNSPAGRQAEVAAERTTSAVAGALWWPYRIAPKALARTWALASLSVYGELAARPEESGVRLVEGVMGETRLDELGSWAARVPGLRAATAEAGTLLILDDALVHSDAARLGHMKRVLFDAAQRHQVLLFTCHPEWWRDMGVAVRTLGGAGDHR